MRNLFRSGAVFFIIAGISLARIIHETAEASRLG